jgi:hypothetical protein
MILEIPENCYRCKYMVKEVTTNCQCKDPIITLFGCFMIINIRLMPTILFFISSIISKKFFNGQIKNILIFFKRILYFIYTFGIFISVTLLELIKKLEILRIFR